MVFLPIFVLGNFNIFIALLLWMLQAAAIGLSLILIYYSVPCIAPSKQSSILVSLLSLSFLILFIRLFIHSFIYLLSLFGLISAVKYNSDNYRIMETGGTHGVMVSAIEMDPAVQVQNLNEAVCFSHSSNTFEKVTNPMILPLVMGK